MTEPKRYLINDIANGKSDPEKLSRIYQDLKLNILNLPALQSSSRSTAVQKPTFDTQGWELYKIQNSIIMIEYFGITKSDSQESNGMPHYLQITIHDSLPSLEEKIESILARHPYGNSRDLLNG